MTSRLLHIIPPTQLWWVKKVKVFYLAHYEHIWGLFCKLCQTIQTKLVSLLPNGSKYKDKSGNLTLFNNLWNMCLCILFFLIRIVIKYLAVSNSFGSYIKPCFRCFIQDWNSVHSLLLWGVMQKLGQLEINMCTLQWQSSYTLLAVSGCTCPIITGLSTTD